MILSYIKNRPLWLFGLIGLLAFVVARWAIPAEAVVAVVVKCGYWVMLANGVLFGWAIWRLLHEDLVSWHPGKRGIWALVLVLLVGTVWQAHEERGFKILADEVLLLGTSMDLHYEREPTYPIRATDVQGPFQVLQGVLDKRPFFFPFVVSLVHDVTGYRATNPFYVNIVLGFFFLGLTYVIATKVAGTPWAGSLGVLLFGGLPLMAQQAAGGGFELLNLVMLLVVLWLACRYAERPDAASMTALCLAVVLLAQTRYESALFILPVGALVIWGWTRLGKILLPGPVWLTPVFLMPYVLQNRQFDTNASLWELAGQGSGATAPFSLGYLPDNLGHALAFFFDTSGYQPNSIFFAAVGLIALPFFCVWLTRVLREPGKNTPLDVAVAWFGVGLLAVNLLFMVYFWGQFDHPVIRRLSLPLHLCMMLAVCVVISRWIRWRPIWQVACAATVIALIVQGLPAMAKRSYEKEYTPGIEMAWRSEFADRMPARDFLFIDQDSVFWITRQVTATPIKQAQLRREGLAYHLRNHSFSAMYVFQRFTVDEDTGRLTIDPADDLGPGFVCEPVEERRISTLLIGRISKITAIEEEGGQVSKAVDFVELAPEPPLTSAQLDEAKAPYLDNWIKQLP